MTTHTHTPSNMAILAMNTFYLVGLLLALALCIIEAAPKNALVTNLPGFNGTLPSKHYAGYVTIDEDSGITKNLFYYFVASEGSPTTDPVVLWLNGGPGCSSFDGFVYEHGPFNFQKGTPRGNLPVLHLNSYSWSKVSNIIYLDSPAGVGFSYSNNSSAYVTGDIQTAIDTQTFLLKWFEQFPEFLTNPFYIAGESYAGVYVPTLASNVVQGIRAGDKPTINFKGYMVGNGVTDEQFDGNALVPFAHGMALISESMFQDAQKYCKGNYYDSGDEKCDTALNKIHEALGGLNIYDILEPCYHSPSAALNDTHENTTLPLSFKQLGVTDRPLSVRQRIFGRAWPYLAPVRAGLVTLWPQLMQANSLQANSVPCMDDEVASTWLNNAEVRQAIHASPESGEWSLCSGELSYRHDAGSMINYHKNLTLGGYRALIFSGDHDMCVPYTGSEAWTSSLGYEIVDEWRSWESNQQVAGYTQGYANNLTFLTIKGSGHTVPEYKPREALDFYSRWLGGKPI